jgi:hypothetical protein
MINCNIYQRLRDELSFEFKRILVGRCNSSGSDLQSCNLSFDDLIRDPDVARQCLKKWQRIQRSETIYKTIFVPGMQGSHSEIVLFQSPLATFARSPTWISHLHWCSICGEGKGQADGIICEVHQCKHPQGAFFFQGWSNALLVDRCCLAACERVHSVIGYFGSCFRWLPWHEFDLMFSFQNDVVFHRFNAAAGIWLQEALPVSTQQSAVWATSAVLSFHWFRTFGARGGIRKISDF